MRIYRQNENVQYAKKPNFMIQAAANGDCGDNPEDSCATIKFLTSLTLA
jgi:hypothetical protein